MSLFDKTTDALATSIAMRQIRQSVTQANIANAETPNYHAKKVDFEAALAQALDIEGNNSLGTSDGAHFATGGKPAVNPGIYENPEGEIGNDGNTVNLEREMAALTENTILNKTAMQLINRKMAMMKYAISESR